MWVEKEKLKEEKRMWPQICSVLELACSKQFSTDGIVFSQWIISPTLTNN